MNKTTEITVSECYQRCPYYGVVDGNTMACLHPFFDDKPPYSNLIIDKWNARNKTVPNACPLRKGQFTETRIINLKYDEDF
jgi:hypothetical protein